jgi:hypothetical protein
MERTSCFGAVAYESTGFVFVSLVLLHQNKIENSDGVL